MDAQAATARGQEGPAPQVWVELADDQSVTAELLARIKQPSSGEWWCELRLTVWAELHLEGGKVVPEPCEVVFKAPARLVTPIDGTDYSAVPTRRPGPQTHDRLAAEFTGRWSLQRLPTAVGHKPRPVLHYETCWLGDREPTLTLDDARRALFEGAEPCQGCGAERLNELRHPPGTGSVRHW
ncbi:hypothetical protein IPZ58_28275 [Streptomyces roseoverticillatus]|uniref:DUF6233 domain-containing protein n=1 Tax=Streptomyces roseoverticillatus TaxID=66429 RepID=UPI001F2B8E47|nr:DUF6233 domain-containing protein [Streptomyces roseoverticillatus]MCF3105458.1 hypothetical protein [Streptomyces roseoverticillatus]